MWSRRRPQAGLFVTGTGTEVGKTYVSALLARSLVQRGVRVGVYKPVASGCQRDADGNIVADDAVQLWEAAGRPATLHQVCPQRFLAPLAPPFAAAAEGKVVDAELLREGLSSWAELCDFVLVEGAGGLMSPLTPDEYNADLASDLGYPLLVVAPNRLGVINDTLQTLITAATYCEGLPVAGVVLNSISSQGDLSCGRNAQELAARCVPPLLGDIPWLAREWGSGLDWTQILPADRPSDPS